MFYICREQLKRTKQITNNMRTTKKINLKLLEACFPMMPAIKEQYVIESLLVMWVNLEFKIAEYYPEIEGEFKYKTMYLDDMNFMSYKISIRTDGKDPGFSDFDMLNILMYNFLNQ